MRRAPQVSLLRLLLLSSLTFIARAQTINAVMACPPSTTGATLPYRGAGDPAAGSPFADNLIETLTPQAWYTYLMGAVVLQRCLKNQTKTADGSAWLHDFGMNEALPSAGRSFLIPASKQLWYNYTDYARAYPDRISSVAPPALSFGSILSRTACPELAAGAPPPIPLELRTPGRIYGPNETQATPDGAAFVISGSVFQLKISPHFIVHFCARQVDNVTVGPPLGWAYQMVAGKTGFNVACLLARRVGFGLIFTTPSFTTTLESGAHAAHAPFLSVPELLAHALTLLLRASCWGSPAQAGDGRRARRRP